MDTIGMDLHKRESQLCSLADTGEISERRIATTRERLTAVLGHRPPARILLEASTESEWVARHLESLGHDVIVADPNFAPMYATRRRGVKTDRRDARTLMDALRLGAYRAVHRASAVQRHVRAQLAVRDALIRTRTRYVNVARALTRRDGLRLTSGGAEHLEARLAALDLAPALQAELAPLRVVLEPVNAQIEQADAWLAATAGADPLIQRLCTTPQVGPVTAVAFVATLDDVTRFRTAHQVEGYLGLTPREHSSGERQHRGRISKTGSPRMRALLVEAGWRILRSRDPALTHLHAWGLQIGQRRGMSIAAVALARRLAGILYALWRDGTTYQAPGRRDMPVS